MNLNLNHEGFEPYLVAREQRYDGVQYRFRFDNGYGASVIKHGGSYGYHIDMWELAVIKYGDGGNDDWGLTYETPVTDDVIGSQTDEEIRDLLKQIMEL